MSKTIKNYINSSLMAVKKEEIIVANLFLNTKKEIFCSGLFSLFLLFFIFIIHIQIDSPVNEINNLKILNVFYVAFISLLTLSLSAFLYKITNMIFNKKIDLYNKREYTDEYIICLILFITLPSLIIYLLVIFSIFTENHRILYGDITFIFAFITIPVIYFTTLPLYKNLFKDAKIQIIPNINYKDNAKCQLEEILSSKKLMEEALQMMNEEDLKEDDYNEINKLFYIYKARNKKEKEKIKKKKEFNIKKQNEIKDHLLLLNSDLQLMIKKENREIEIENI